jgi:hypothetical protein
MTAGAVWDNLQIKPNGSNPQINAGGAENGLSLRVSAENTGDYTTQTYETVTTLYDSQMRVLNGNKETLRIRPDDGLTRGEMAVMLHRAQLVQAGANICGSM